jgi:catechol 2,3-dioxygenase-like lactoylglutathione lyase family enzyme
MAQGLALSYVTLVVREYEEAIAFFTEALGIKLIEDTVLGEGKRWLSVASPHSRHKVAGSLGP